MKYLPQTVLLLFVAVLAAIGEDSEFQQPNESKEDECPRVVFTYGPSGPVRQSKTFFAGETLSLLIEVPKKLIPDQFADIYCDVSLTSQTNRMQRIVSPQPIRFDGIVLNEQSCFFQLHWPTPPTFFKGDYDLKLAIQDRKGNALIEGKETIQLRDASEFGIRHVLFFHGANRAEKGVGSYVYIAGETVRLGIEFAGETPDDEGNLEASLDIRLANEDGDELNITDLNPQPSVIKAKVPADGEPLRPHWNQTFAVGQSGKYTIKIRIKEASTEKEDLLELPLIVLDPLQLQ